MSATISDYFNKVSDGSGSYPAVGRVSAARTAGATTLNCESLSGWATDTPVHFSTYQLNQDGSVNAATQTDWKGIVFGSQITNLKRIAGAADTGNAIGDFVVANPTVGWLSDLITGLLVSHQQTGALKANSVSSTALASSAVTAAKLASSAVTTAKLADDAVTADKVDWTTIHQTGWSYATATASTKATATVSLSGVDAIENIKSINLTLLGIKTSGTPSSIADFDTAYAEAYPTVIYPMNITKSSFTATIMRPSNFGAGWKLGFCYDVEYY